MQKNSVELKNIRKEMAPGCWANDGVSLSLARGSIHAVVGENGAGKSTAMKVLYGQIVPDEGEIWIDGERVNFSSPAHALARGIGMVHQHFMLAETHSALDNILLGTHGFPYLRLGAAQARIKLNQLMEKFGMRIPLDIPVEELSIGDKQRIEILRLLFQDSEILILDEPTAVLSPPEVEALFLTLEQLAAAGKTIVVVTHKLKEVVRWAKELTVLRAGKTVAQRSVAGASVAEVASLMVSGGVVPHTEVERLEPQHDFALEVIQAKSSLLKEMSFRVRRGEILGIAGVEGNGQSELLNLLISPAENLESGKILLRGKNISHATTAEIRAEKVGILPEDRLRDALSEEASLEANFLLGRHRRFSRNGILGKKQISDAAMRVLQNFSVRPLDSDVPAFSLSGGNQQKFVVGREMENSAAFLLAAHPTRGVDIGAVDFIHAKLMELRNEGAGVLLVSSDLDELFKLCDRLLVLYRGQVVGSFLRKDFSEKAVGALMAGAK